MFLFQYLISTTLKLWIDIAFWLHLIMPWIIITRGIVGIVDTILLPILKTLFMSCASIVLDSLLYLFMNHEPNSIDYHSNTVLFRQPFLHYVYKWKGIFSESDLWYEHSSHMQEIPRWIPRLATSKFVINFPSFPARKKCKWDANWLKYTMNCFIYFVSDYRATFNTVFSFLNTSYRSITFAWNVHYDSARL